MRERLLVEQVAELAGEHVILFVTDLEHTVFHAEGVAEVIAELVPGNFRRPAGEVLAVEERDPFALCGGFVVGGCGERGGEQCQEGKSSDGVLHGVSLMCGLVCDSVGIPMIAWPRNETPRWNRESRGSAMAFTDRTNPGPPHPAAAPPPSPPEARGRGLSGYCAGSSFGRLRFLRCLLFELFCCCESRRSCVYQVCASRSVAALSR